MESFDVSEEIDLSFLEEKIEEAVSEKENRKKAAAKHPQLKHKTEKKGSERKPSCIAKA